MNTNARNSGFSMRLDQLATVWRRHGRGIYSASLLLAVGSITAISLLPNVYRATTTILVDPQKIPEKYVSSTVTTDPNGRLNTLTQQVLSSSRLQEVVDRNNLYPELRRTRSREEVLDYMRDKTKIELKQGPESEPGLSSFSISYEDRNPAVVARIANQLAANFIAWNLRARQQAAAGTTEFLTAEATRAKRSLEDQEQQLQAFRIQHAGATPEELDSNLQTLSHLQSELESNMDAISRLEQERILVEHSAATDAQTNSLTERQRMLQEKRRLENEQWLLKKQFTELYPDLIANQMALRAIDGRLALLPKNAADDGDADMRLTLLDSQIRRRKEQGQGINARILIYQTKVNAVPVLQTQMVELTRNYEASRANYQSLLDKTFSAGMSEELERNQQAERFTVLDLARTPEKPIWPARVPLVAAAIGLSVILPWAIAYLVCLSRGRVLSSLEVRESLPRGMTTFVSVPLIRSQLDLQRAQSHSTKVIVMSLVASTTLLYLLMKVRPIL
jgi:succinoglycan biosynthesis transport protein ExoP